MSTSLKITKARANLIMMHPFFGTLALRLKMVEDNTVKTSVTDGITIRYNSKYVDDMPMSKVQGMLAHSVMHPAFLHHTRRGGRDAKKWNKACDYSINTILKNAKFDLPEGTFEDPKYNGMTAEHIYNMLPIEEDDDKTKNGDGGDGGGSSDDPGGDGGVTDSPSSQNAGASKSKEGAEETEWKIAVAQAAHVAKQNGKLPGDIERMIEELFQPVILWKDILRRFMTEKCNDDFSWTRGNRRFLAQGLYLPTRQSDNAMGEVVVCIDTSGSIGEKELNEFSAEIKGIIEETNPSEVIVMYCDSRVAHVDRFPQGSEVMFAAHGGGGTDFRPPFKWLENKQIVPKVFVYLTDGYGNFPEEELPYPVMWCINNGDVVPPHGEHLIISV